MIDTSNWELFDFSKIFIMKSGFYNKKPESDATGTIPFIGATDKNNGVTAYLSIEEIESASKTGIEPNHSLDDKLFPPDALCLTNNGSVGYAYYQNKEFTCSHDVTPLYLIEGNFNKFTALFISTIIMHDRYRWGYGRKWRPKRMIHSKLSLPILRDRSGNPVLDESYIFSDKGFTPDWLFMEQYMKSLQYQLPTTINDNSMTISVNEWKSFTFLDLDINIYKAKAHAKIDMDFSKKRVDNTIPFVSRTELNNSVDGWVHNEGIVGLEDGNALVIGDTTSTISYQQNSFVAGDHIVVIRASWLNKYTGLFIQTLLSKEKFRYSYGRAYKMELIKKTLIYLPVIDDGQIDWIWIEKYIKSLPYSDSI